MKLQSKTRDVLIKDALSGMRKFLFNDYVFFTFAVIILSGVFIIWIRKVYFYLDFNIIYLIFIFPLILISISRIFKIQIRTSELLTIISILSAVFFFLYQGATNNFNKDMIIDGANRYNCQVGCNNIYFLNNLSDKSSRFTLSYFERDIYLQNLDFIPKKYKEKRFDFLNTIYKIGTTNRLLDLVLLMNTTTASPPELFIWRNQQILELSKDISNELNCLCANDEQ